MAMVLIFVQKIRCCDSLQDAHCRKYDGPDKRAYFDASQSPDGFDNLATISTSGSGTDMITHD